MKRAVFDPNIHGRHTWGESWTVEVETALEELGRVLERRHVGAIALRGESAVYAMREGVILGVGWIEPEMCDGRVVGMERFVGTVAGSA